jgi:hypothetical protein
MNLLVQITTPTFLAHVLPWASEVLNYIINYIYIIWSERNFHLSHNYDQFIMENH